MVARRWKLWSILLAVTMCTAALPARAAVEDYLPGDSLGVIKVADGGAQVDKFLSSALWERLQDPLFIPDLAPNLDQLRTGLDEVRRSQGIDMAQVMRDLLGREFALVAVPGDQWALVAQGRDAATVRRAVDDFLQIETLTGGISLLSSSAYNGVDVFGGSTRKGKRYHAVIGDVLVVSMNEAAVKRVIDVSKRSVPALSASAQYRDAMAMAPRPYPRRRTMLKTGTRRWDPVMNIRQTDRRAASP